MIISWPLHLERRLRLVPRAEADFKHLVAALAKGGLICAANPGFLRLGDEKREALINCVWWGVCKCVYWKIGSVIVTTLATASYFVGSADTKVNKQTKKKMQNLLRKVFKRALNQIRTWLSGLRKHRQTTTAARPFSSLLALWRRSSCTFQTNSQKMAQPTGAGAFREAKNSSYCGRPSTWVADRARARRLSYRFSPLSLDPICSVDQKWT